RPKALLPFAGEPLIAHVVDRLRAIFADVVIVAAPGQDLPPLPARLTRDDVPFQGPVGGIYYGLSAAATEVAFVTPCDAPFLNLELIAYLVGRVSEHDVVVPRWQDRLQPLHAVYRKDVTPVLKDQLDRGELRPVFLYQKVRTLEVTEGEIRRFDPEGLSFLNMNTPDDYARALEQWERQRHELQREETRRQGEISPGLHGSRSPCLNVTVELLGVARLLAKTREIPLSFAAPASLSEVYEALAEACPVLVGRVIAQDKRSLARGYACNINGRDFVRNGAAKVNPGDRVFILSADAGG
ncbi:MAG TPA: NTP transferase domain-containing protein, partial [Candidatus Eisenbacteria bacterium]|nr:NTP transferase domain-containing protein [Candidatus Eisenbacteria bacterium]